MTSQRFEGICIYIHANVCVLFWTRNSFSNVFIKIYFLKFLLFFFLNTAVLQGFLHKAALQLFIVLVFAYMCVCVRACACVITRHNAMGYSSRLITGSLKCNLQLTGQHIPVIATTE